MIPFPMVTTGDAPQQLGTGARGGKPRADNPHLEDGMAHPDGPQEKGAATVDVAVQKGFDLHFAETLVPETPTPQALTPDATETDRAEPETTATEEEAQSAAPDLDAAQAEPPEDQQDADADLPYIALPAMSPPPRPKLSPMAAIHPALGVPFVQAQMPVEEPTRRPVVTPGRPPADFDQKLTGIPLATTNVAAMVERREMRLDTAKTRAEAVLPAQATRSDAMVPPERPAAIPATAAELRRAIPEPAAPPAAPMRTRGTAPPPMPVMFEAIPPSMAPQARDQLVLSPEIVTLHATETAAPTSWTPTVTAPGAIFQRPDTPQIAASQMVEVLQRSGNRPVDLTLNPEELGRVRMSITTAEAGVTVNVLAERAETLELLRRHIDILGQEFQALGYENIAFSFAGASSDDAGDQRDPPSENDIAPLPDGDTATPIHLSARSSTGVDIRL